MQAERTVPDPYYVSRPESTGFVPVKGHKIYFELRGLQNKEKLVVLCPFAFTLKLHEQYADTVAIQHQVLLLDNRGTGKSTAPPGPMSSKDLAQDALQVVDHVWPGERVHVAGPSMGGFVAQHLACMLLPQQRLASLYLMVTCLGFRPRLRFPLAVFELARKFIFRGSRREIIRRIFVHNLTPGVAEHPTQDRSGKQTTVGNLWEDIWLEQYDDWFCITNKPVMAAQIQLVIQHNCSKARQQELKDSRVPIMAYVAQKDKTIDPKDQRRMVRHLAAHSHESPTGHLCVFDDFESLIQMQMSAIQKGSNSSKGQHSQQMQAH